ncbi:MAG: hypothetical protein RSA91_00540 [Bacilli bacterium]
MRKRQYFDKEWKQRTFRIREEAIEIYTYLEYKAVAGGLSKYALFDKIVEESITDILKNNPPISIKDFNSKREVKGFTISTEIEEILEKLIGINDLGKGEVVEILIGLYAKNNLTEEELKSLKTYLY